MIPVTPARTPELSRLKRKYHVIEALYWRKDGNKQMKRHCLDMARVERINKGDFLGDEMPF
ncbi:hypothetical protein FHC77_06745 [Atlantibacter hermannii]|uniref:hypothetical protein n=1 Tax=Atlantibacter hermannii TaxID=565 RepID=UPI001C6FE54A|nr:hypothetical protein [Atlantibacter hermannii]MBW9430443.1 hypothetical protein [Atlantibacter hermannii]